MTTNWQRIMNLKAAKPQCFCGRKENLIVFCGFYVCTWCKLGTRAMVRLNGRPAHSTVRVMSTLLQRNRGVK